LNFLAETRAKSYPKIDFSMPFKEPKFQPPKQPSQELEEENIKHLRELQEETKKMTAEELAALLEKLKELEQKE
jgi:hypothetical protein